MVGLLALMGWLAFRTTTVETAETAETDSGFQIVATYPHDASSFTQGLEFVDGALVESAGQYGESQIRITNPKTGAILDSLEVDDDLFAEGITVVENKIFQLSWKSETVLTYELNGTRLDASTTSFSYDGEGWGLCETASGLLRSDGTRTLTLHDKQNFDAIGNLTLTGFDELSRINELECTAKTAWANVFGSNKIVQFDLETGEIVRVLDLSRLVPETTRSNQNAVLNGIAIHPDTGNMWVTGKLWPTMFELKISPS